jgi:hypothetical protein
VLLPTTVTGIEAEDVHTGLKQAAKNGGRIRGGAQRRYDFG